MESVVLRSVGPLGLMTDQEDGLDRAGGLPLQAGIGQHPWKRLALE